MKGIVDQCDITGSPGMHWHGSAFAHQSADDMNFVEIPCMFRQNILAWLKWKFSEANPSSRLWGICFHEIYLIYTTFSFVFLMDRHPL